MKKVYFVSIISLVVFFAGCSSQKNITYFTGVNSNSADSINKKFSKIHEARICTGDLLSITVTGLDPLAVAPFNLPLVSYATPGSDRLNSQPTLQSYLVDINGNINFPVVGTLKLVGLTKSQAIKYINDKLEPYLKNAIVSIQFMNFNVTVLGEVLRPGQYSISNERVTILDALGLAGDMTIYGKRNNVLITRENSGKLEFVRLNLNNADIFKSPFYYLQQNDVIYVEPNSVKSFSAQSQNFSLYLSSVATLATLLTSFVLITRK